MNICHLTSVHSRADIRIFLKECISLDRAGYSVSLIVADNQGDSIVKNISIIDVGSVNGRIRRMITVARSVFDKARALDADLYHIHDPELIPVGLKLKRLGKKVIFDAHEDVPRQLLSKPYLSKPVSRVFSQIFSVYEMWACKRFDAIITATPFICDKFLRIHPQSVAINNYPLLDEFVFTDIDRQEKQKHVCYVGGITASRGIKEIVQAADSFDDKARIQLVGKFIEPDVHREVQSYSGWKRVDALGWLDRNGVRDVLHRSAAGLVTFHGIPNHIDAQPNKMFEYMSAGIPVVASRFPLWQQIIEGRNCGICVDPQDPEEIAQAVSKLITDTELAAAMGTNGRKAIEDEYNWQNEEQKLIDLYRKIL